MLIIYVKTKRNPHSANEHQLNYFASKDMGVAHSLSRHFFWQENILWKHELNGRRVTVSLSGRDLIVDTKSVANYLTKDGAVLDTDDSTPSAPNKNSWRPEGLNVVWFSDLDHSQVFDRRHNRTRIGDITRSYCIKKRQR